MWNHCFEMFGFFFSFYFNARLYLSHCSCDCTETQLYLESSHKVHLFNYVLVDSEPLIEFINHQLSSSF